MLPAKVIYAVRPVYSGAARLFYGLFYKCLCNAEALAVFVHTICKCAAVLLICKGVLIAFMYIGVSISFIAPLDRLACWWKLLTPGENAC